MSRLKLLTVIVCVAAALSVAAVALSVREDSPSGYLAKVQRKSSNVGIALRQDVAGITKGKGATFAIDVVANAYNGKTISIDDCHLLLHLIGHQTYQVYGSDFEKIFSANHPNLCLGGYIHGVEAEIAAGGDVREMQYFCALIKERHATNEPCFHGAGHGIFETTKDVKRSLAFCNSLAGNPEPDLSNCYRGVFSEIGNEMGGADTNTGLPTKPFRDAQQHILPEEPYALCDVVNIRYQDACYSQLAKLFYGSDRPLYGIEGCIAGSPTKAAQDICISIVAALAGRLVLDTKEPVDLAVYINTLPVAIQKAALSGARQAYDAHFIEPQEFRWESLCESIVVQSTRVSCIKREFI